MITYRDRKWLRKKFEKEAKDAKKAREDKDKL